MHLVAVDDGLLKGNVGDNKVIEVLRRVRPLEDSILHICARIELSCQPCRKALHLYAIKDGFCHNVPWHTAKEIAHTHSRVKNTPALEAKVGKSCPDCLYNLRRRVVSTEGRTLCVLVFFCTQKGAKFLVGFAPFLELGRKATPAVELSQYLLLGRRCHAFLVLKLSEQLDSIDILFVPYIGVSLVRFASAFLDFVVVSRRFRG